jgi:hypothetical protein
MELYCEICLKFYYPMLSTPHSKQSSTTVLISREIVNHNKNQVTSLDTVWRIKNHSKGTSRNVGNAEQLRWVHSFHYVENRTSLKLQQTYCTCFVFIGFFRNIFHSNKYLVSQVVMRAEMRVWIDVTVRCCCQTKFECVKKKIRRIYQ